MSDKPPIRGRARGRAKSKEDENRPGGGLPGSDEVAAGAARGRSQLRQPMPRATSPPVPSAAAAYQQPGHRGRMRVGTPVQMPSPAQQFAPVQSGGYRPSRPLNPQQPQPPRQPSPAPSVSAVSSQAQQDEPVQRADTAQSRAYYRGAEPRAAAAGSRAPQGSATGGAGVSAVEQQMAAMQVSTGNGSNGNGSEEVAVGRGMSRGKGRFTDGRLAIQKPYIVNKRGTRMAHNTKDVPLIVNYIKLQKSDERWRLYHYSLQYSPPQDDRRIIREIMKPHFAKFGDNYVFDVMGIYSTRKLPEEVTKFVSRVDTDYHVTATLVRELEPMDFQFMSILNRILRLSLNHLKLVQIGRHFFNPNECINLAPALPLTVYPGYQTSIREHENDILLCADIVHKFQQTETVLDAIRNNTITSDNLIGQVVMCKYNYMTYRCDGLVMDMSPMSQFEYRGEKVTYKDYFEKKYNLRVTNPKQPLIYCKPTSRQRRSGINDIYLVPEFVTLTGIPETSSKDRKLGEYNKMGPDKRVAALMRFNRTLINNPQVVADLNSWGLKLSERLLQINARQLPQETIYISGNRPAEMRFGDWSRAYRNQGNQMAHCVPLEKWAVLCPKRLKDACGLFLKDLCGVAGRLGMHLSKPQMVVIRDLPSIHDYARDNAGCQMLLIILDRYLADRYGQIKKYLACQLGVLSQCVTARVVEKKSPSVLEMILVQINAKLGGEPWRVAHEVKNIMAVGYDAYHDSCVKRRSYGAVVSALNSRGTNYFGQVNPHENREEVSEKFGTYVTNALNEFRRANEGRTPETIVVFRDGVGEGQEMDVKNSEIPGIKSALKKAAPDQSINLLFIVVTKRLNTRIFKQGQRGNSWENPQPGTILDHTITLPEKFDFYLVSQITTQGTISPTGYNILEDTQRMSVDKIQQMCYKFTHLYYNSLRTIRVPAPCHYAHKLAFMTGTGTHDIPTQNIANKLWFI